MKTRIKSIPIALAKAGMKLGKTICDSRGQILLMAGGALAESQLDRLRMRGVTTISILVEETRTEEELRVERAKVLDRLNFLFRDGMNKNSTLYYLMLEYRMEKLV